jgi:hypothetical protein
LEGTITKQTSIVPSSELLGVMYGKNDYQATSQSQLPQNFQVLDAERTITKQSHSRSFRYIQRLNIHISIKEGRRENADAAKSGVSGVYAAHVVGGL